MNTLKENDKIKVHMYDWKYSDHREIKTRAYDKIFTVYKKNGELGIDWKEDEFAPFRTFASSVIFENVESGESYSFSTIKNALEKVDNAVHRGRGKSR